MPKKKTKTETFTSGPWLAQEENGGFIEIVDKADRLIVQIISDGPAAKKSAGWVPAAEAEANKRLVLSSPRLYRVLKNLTARIEAMRSALQKKDLEFSILWLDDGILADAQAVLTETAPRTRPVPVPRGPAKKA
jgi:hypothetical protein